MNGTWEKLDAISQFCDNNEMIPPSGKDDYERAGVAGDPPIGVSLFNSFISSRTQFEEENAGAHDLDLRIREGMSAVIVKHPYDSWMEEHHQEWLGRTATVLEVIQINGVEHYRLDLFGNEGQPTYPVNYVVSPYEGFIARWCAFAADECTMHRECFADKNKKLHAALREFGYRRAFDFYNQHEPNLIKRMHKPFETYSSTEIDNRFKPLLVKLLRTDQGSDRTRLAVEIKSGISTIKDGQGEIDAARLRYHRDISFPGDDEHSYRFYPYQPMRFDEFQMQNIEKLHAEMEHLRLRELCQAAIDRNAENLLDDDDDDIEIIPDDDDDVNMEGDAGNDVAAPTPLRVYYSERFNEKARNITEHSRTRLERYFNEMLREFRIEEGAYDDLHTAKKGLEDDLVFAIEQKEVAQETARTITEKYEHVKRVGDMRARNLNMQLEESIRKTSKMVSKLERVKREHEVEVERLKQSVRNAETERDTALTSAGGAVADADMRDQMESLTEELANVKISFELNQKELSESREKITQQATAVEMKATTIQRLQAYIESLQKESEESGESQQGCIFELSEKLKEAQDLCENFQTHDLAQDVVTTNLQIAADEYEPVFDHPGNLRVIARKKWGERGIIVQSQLERTEAGDLPVSYWKNRIRAFGAEAAGKRKFSSKKKKDKTAKILDGTPMPINLKRILQAEALRNAGFGYMPWKDQTDELNQARKQLGSSEGGYHYKEVVQYCDTGVDTNKTKTDEAAASANAASSSAVPPAPARDTSRDQRQNNRDTSRDHRQDSRVWDRNGYSGYDRSNDRWGSHGGYRR